MSALMLCQRHGYVKDGVEVTVTEIHRPTRWESPEVAQKNMLGTRHGMTKYRNGWQHRTNAFRRGEYEGLGITELFTLVWFEGGGQLAFDLDLTDISTLKEVSR